MLLLFLNIKQLLSGYLVMQQMQRVWHCQDNFKRDFPFGWQSLQVYTIFSQAPTSMSTARVTQHVNRAIQPWLLSAPSSSKVSPGVNKVITWNSVTVVELVDCREALYVYKNATHWWISLQTCLPVINHHLERECLSHYCVRFTHVLVDNQNSKMMLLGDQSWVLPWER